MAENKEILKYPSPPTSERLPVKVPELVDQTPDMIMPREVETWMEKLEKDQTQQQTVNDTQGQPLIQPTAPVDPKVVLPVTRATFAQGFKKTVEEAGKWLSVFIFRLIKMKKGKVTFKEET
jgi:hypothetical protein